MKAFDFPIKNPECFTKQPARWYLLDVLARLASNLVLRTELIIGETKVYRAFLFLDRCSRPIT